MNDIINDSGKILSHIEINHTHDLQINRWNWMAIISAIPKSWKEKLFNETCLQKLMETISTNDVYFIINNTAKNVKTTYSKQIYQKLITIKILPQTAINKWVEIYPFMEQLDWKTIFQLPYKITNEPFCKAFNIRC